MASVSSWSGWRSPARTPTASPPIRSASEVAAPSTARPPGRAGADQVPRTIRRARRQAGRQRHQVGHGGRGAARPARPGSRSRRRRQPAHAQAPARCPTHPWWPCRSIGTLPPPGRDQQSAESRSPITRSGRRPTEASHAVPPSTATTRSASSSQRASAASASPLATRTRASFCRPPSRFPACRRHDRRRTRRRAVGNDPHRLLRWHDPDQVRGSAARRTLSAPWRPCRSSVVASVARQGQDPGRRRSMRVWSPSPSPTSARSSVSPGVAKE